MNAARSNKPLLFAAAAGLHVLAFVTITVSNEARSAAREKAEVFKLVDARELREEPAKKELPPPEQRIEIPPRDAPAEILRETELEIVVVEDAPAVAPEAPPAPAPAAEPDYLPQHKISRVPDIPAKEVLSRIVYPELPRRQGLEASVFLELYIDEKGAIRRIVVLKESVEGMGFAQAAVRALEGLQVRPAEANGVPVAVRYRYPVRFSLKA